MTTKPEAKPTLYVEKANFAWNVYRFTGEDRILVAQFENPTDANLYCLAVNNFAAMREALDNLVFASEVIDASETPTTEDINRLHKACSATHFILEQIREQEGK